MSLHTIDWNQYASSQILEKEFSKEFLKLLKKELPMMKIRIEYCVEKQDYGILTKIMRQLDGICRNNKIERLMITVEKVEKALNKGDNERVLRLVHSVIQEIEFILLELNNH